MRFTGSLPEFLRSEAIYHDFLVGPRTRIFLNDTAGAPQSLAAGASIIGTITTSVGVSTPALTNPGADIQLGADEALLIEDLTLQVQARDTSGKLQINNLQLSDPFSIFPLASPLNPFPYTFAPIVGDTVAVASTQWGRGKYARATADNPGSLTYFVTFRYVLTNLDVGAAHTYIRALNLIYRRISGLAPLVPLSYELSS